MARVTFHAGEAMRPYLAQLSRLRMAVFREYPYLYDGSAENEAEHLAAFAGARGAGLAVAFDGEAAVGCSSCAPLAEESEAVRAPFLARGWDVSAFCYFGESVLLPAYRGQGIGVEFFRLREAHARALGADYAAFCAVERPADHTLRPPGHAPLDSFWRKRGFTPYPDLACHFTWKQVDTEAPVRNTLRFWLKSLRGRALP